MRKPIVAFGLFVTAWQVISKMPSTATNPPTNVNAHATVNENAAPSP